MKGGIYKKMTKMFSVTCPDAMGEFINEKEISPSSIFQNAIQQLIDTSKISEEFLKEKIQKIEALKITLGQQRDFIQANGLMDKYLGLC